MAKKYCSLLLLFLLVKPIEGQTAMTTMYLQQSPLFIGAGNVGTASPMQEAMGFYYNPAQLGYFSLENNLSISYMPQKTEWLKNYFPNISIRSFGFAAGYNFKKNSNDLPLSIGVGYLHNKFSYGEFVRTGPDSPDPIGRYESYDKFDCFSLGVGYGDLVKFNLGFSIKSYQSYPGDSPIIQEVDPDGYDGTAFDFGLMIVAPLSDMLFPNQKIILDGGSFLKPNVDFVLGYSLLNIGKEVVYTDSEQKDPLPRTARLGYSFNFSLDLQSNKSTFNFFSYSFSVEADDHYLIKRSTYGGSFEYQNILGDIKFGRNLIELRADDYATVHRGHILRFFETVIFTSGRMHGGGYDHRKTDGLGVSSEGLIKLYSLLAADSIVDYVAKHFVVEYYDTNIFVDSDAESNFKGLVLNVKGIEF